MSTITSMQREGVGSTVQSPVARPPQIKSTPRPGAVTRADQVNLSQPVNPYEGFAEESTRVQVDRWRKGPNDSIERILLNQGYSHQDIYRKDSRGRTLVERVADANGLKDPNLIRPGKGLLVPKKGEAAKPEAAKPEAARPEAARPEAANPEAARPEAAKPEAARPEAARPEAARPEAARPEAARPEAAKPEAARPEAAKPEAARPEAANPEAAQNEAPKQDAAPGQEVEAKPEAATEATEKPKKGRRRFWIFGPRIEEKPEPKAESHPEPKAETTTEQPQPIQQPQPQQPQPQQTEARVETPVDPELAEKESAEVGLLLQGVKDQKFTRSEFQALNATANQYTELRARYTRDGISNEQVRELTQIQHQYGQMYARFLADDNAKVTFKGGDRQDPAARFRAQQNEEGGRLYDQFVAQEIDEAAIKARLLGQRHGAGNLGVNPQ